ncbi:MAG: YdeI/OmpD-associated family protein [Sphingomonas sp.]
MNADPRIDAYIAKSQPFARPILSKVRERVHAVLPDVEETLKWSMPAYTVSGKIVLITAAFKAHTALNFWRGQELETSHSSVGAMGQFGKIKSLDEVPPDPELDGLIRDAAELARNAPAPRKPKHEPRPAPTMHAELKAALAKSPKAKATFDAFAPSCRREYVEWVGEAKRDETRAKRIATTIEWLSEGKKRNWKYENC